MFRDSGEQLEEFPDKVAALPRRFKILRTDLERVGYSQGCEQCEHVLRYNVVKPGIQHTEKCRARVMAELAKDPRGQQRLKDTEERVNRALSERLQG